MSTHNIQCNYVLKKNKKSYNNTFCFVGAKKETPLSYREHDFD